MLSGGPWRNVEELEECLTLEELEFMVKAGRDKEERTFRFHAAIKGINLDENDEETTKTSFEAIKERAAAKAAGMTEKEYADYIARKDATDFSDFGIDFEE